MKKLPKKIPKTGNLRERAEQRLRVKTKAPGRGSAETDSRRLLHELQVHEIELKLQNEELGQARNELETALARYTDLYDFAPTAYFTLGVAAPSDLAGVYLGCIRPLRSLSGGYGRRSPAGRLRRAEQRRRRVFSPWH